MSQAARTLSSVLADANTTLLFRLGNGAEELVAMRTGKDSIGAACTGPQDSAHAALGMKRVCLLDAY